MSATLSARLKVLAGKATPGPWFAAHGEGDGGITRVDDGRTAHDCLFPFECEAHDAELIVALRNALPELLSALEDRDALLGMLAVAKCPNGCEPGQGWYMACERGEPTQVQCQWCDEQRVRLDAARAKVGEIHAR